MGRNLTQKIIAAHLVEGDLAPGRTIGLRIDQTLTQDATGTLAWLEFEALGLDRVRTELSVSYVDHNLLQTDFKNADDHRFLRSAAARFGAVFSPPGNGICHHVHLEQFARPGRTLLGSDSHTPTAGGAGMLAIGAGGLDVAAAMAGRPFFVTPRVLGVRLVGRLPDWVAAKDVILELLRRRSVKGGVGFVLEYFGEGVQGLSVPQRGVIANMGAELGATSSVFPSDERTAQFLRAMGRPDQFTPLAADEGAAYDEVETIDLDQLEPLIARPSMPDNVVPVREAAGLAVDQVIIGSCANSSLTDLALVAAALEGRRVYPGLTLDINPGSRQILMNLSASGDLNRLLLAGARLNQPGCLGCLGLGQAPPTGAVSLRTMPRNFPGRSGTRDDQVYLCSPEVAVAAALTGRIVDPRELGDYPSVSEPESYLGDSANLVFPPQDGRTVEIVRGPNIAPFPELEPLPEDLTATVILKVGDDVTTDHILPAGAEVLPLRSNIPAISACVFQDTDDTFCDRIARSGPAAVLGGENYGQGSSREHAALAPRFLGVRVKLAKSFARIHRANLINFGIVPLTFADPRDYDRLNQGDRLEFTGWRRSILDGQEDLDAAGPDGPLRLILSADDRERRTLAAGGRLGLVRRELQEEGR
ncbi:MAG: aconitate hydratase [Proteobacteria bacterium]|nr:aconitate hydratase [Pseudomonadota bacterium]